MITTILVLLAVNVALSIGILIVAEVTRSMLLDDLKMLPHNTYMLFRVHKEASRKSKTSEPGKTKASKPSNEASKSQPETSKPEAEPGKRKTRKYTKRAGNKVSCKRSNGIRKAWQRKRRSDGQRKAWANLTAEQKRIRAHKMTEGRRIAALKRNGGIRIPSTSERNTGSKT